jgi:DNA-binding NarL/FixJ family response regulator
MMTKQTLLYVDDDVRHRDSLVRDLKERGGYVIYTAATVKEALTLAAKHTPHIALIDIQIPYSDPHETGVNAHQQQHGIRLGEKLDEQYPDLALLFYSNFDDCFNAVDKLAKRRKARLRECRARGSVILPGTGYILKGADVATISAALQEVARGNCWIDRRVPDYEFRPISQQFLNTMDEKAGKIITEGFFSLPNLTTEQARFLEQLGRTGDIRRAAQALSLTEKNARDRADAIYRKLFDGLNLPATMHKAHLAARVWTLYALEEGIVDRFDDPHH